MGSEKKQPKMSKYESNKKQEHSKNNLGEMPWGEIRCQYCKRWFKSPIYFGSAEAYFSTSTKGNITTCPHCKKMTGCNKSNMRWCERKENGRVTYIEGNEAF